MPRWFQSLRVRLILFVFIAALPALALILLNGLEQRRIAAEGAKDDALRIVRFAAVNESLIMENTRGFLISLAHAIAPETGNLQHCQVVFSHLLQTHFPHYSAFYVADLQGNIVCSMPSGDQPDHLPTCEHFNRIIATADYTVSNFHICRNSGKAVISMGYPVWDINRNMSGVINVSLDLAIFNDLVANTNMPPGSTFTILDREGGILALFPDAGDWVGKQWPAGVVRDTILGQSEGTTEGPGLDGVQRLYAFMPLEGAEGGVYLTVGIPSELAYAEADRTLLRNLILLSGATLLAILAAWFLGELFILRQTNNLVQATHRLAAGELDTRTGVPYDAGELGQLARSFDQMAASLEQRSLERDAAEAAMRAYAADLERSNRDLQDYANIASHDMQEPLRKIRTFADLLRTRYGKEFDARGQTYLERMYNSAGRLQRLTEDLLTFSSISTKADLSLKTDLNELVRGVLADLDLEIESSGARIELKPLPVLEADPTQMRHLFHNLLSNALKFHHPDRKPVVTITAQELAARVAPASSSRTFACHCQITIQDNGIGFEDKYLDRIFQPFQRLHSREAYPGTGMGLAIARKIVERHHGTLSASSVPGSGTCFIIDLPCQQVEENHNERA